MTARTHPADEFPVAQASARPAQPPDKGRRRPASAARRRGAMTRHKDAMFPPDLDWLPPPRALTQNPELAMLAVLHTTLEALVLALVAFYPQLAFPEPPPDRESLAAHRLRVGVWHFQHRITRYCRDLAARCAPPVRGNDDEPFLFAAHRRARPRASVSAPGTLTPEQRQRT